MYKMINESIKLLLALVLAPVITSIVTAPFLFSKTFVQLYIRDPYEFSRKTAFLYFKRTSIVFLSLTIIWSGGVYLATILATEVTQQLSQNLLGFFILVSVLYVLLFSTRANVLRDKMGIQTEFFPDERKHTIILTGITSIQILILFFVFAIIFYLL